MHFRPIQSVFLLTIIIMLAGCNTSTATIEPVEHNQPVQHSFNGTWASNCVYNQHSGYYETIDYDINRRDAAILISSYFDRNCTRFTFEELYEGEVSQTDTVILNNGLQASRLNFFGYDQINNVQITHTAYFHVDSLHLYEYPTPNDNFTYEYERIL